eukprot:Nitzschia sp. Nitz4//scaffold48_size128905//8730//9950//NITZ4_003576-RA/size128905-processed-gene-0.71-mRNA-1//1//CDS//3329552910//3823//frame0
MPPSVSSSTQSSSTTLKLNPVAVRERAKRVPGCKEVFASGDSVVSFVVGLGSNRPEDLARINIFVDTGTIGTSRVLGGKVRQSFRRNVSSLDVVERLLKKPETFVNIDQSLLGLQDANHSRSTHSNQPLSTPGSLQKELELADVGLCILQGEREKLAKHLESFNAPPSPASTNDSSDGSDDSLSGLEFRFSLPADVMVQVDQCLRDITKMDKIVKGVATNGKGTVFLYGNGGVAYTPSIPRALYQKLRQLRNSSFNARPCYMSLGTRDRYYVAFNDNTADWKGPKPLDKILKKCLQAKQPPRSVAFGGSYDSFFVVFHDGSWQYQGRSIPESLEKKLNARDDRADLVTVNLGPSGEWFVKARNGRMWWSGISADLDKVIAGILNAGHYLRFLDFGENGSYFISYED